MIVLSPTRGPRARPRTIEETAAVKRLARALNFDPRQDSTPRYATAAPDQEREVTPR